MEKYKRFYPTEENPRYGEAFMIDGIQLEDIDHNFTEMFDIVGNKLIRVGKNWEEFKRCKKRISDDVCKKLNQGNSGIRYKDVVSIRVRYLGDKTPQII